MESTGNGFERIKPEKKHWVIPLTNEKAGGGRKPGKRCPKRGESRKKISNIGSIKVTFRYAISNSVIKHPEIEICSLSTVFWRCGGSTEHKFSKSSFSILLEHHPFYFGLCPLDPTMCNIASINHHLSNQFDSSQSTLKGVLVSQSGSSCFSQ
jgi:hypothetical protein